jgi:hypothetical protein
MLKLGGGHLYDCSGVYTTMVAWAASN